MIERIDLKWVRALYGEAGSRFARYYRGYVQAHARDFDALAAEMYNVFTAIDLHYDVGDWAGVVDVVETFDGFLLNQGYWTEALHYDRLAVEAARRLFSDRPEEPSRGLELIRFQTSLATIYALRGRYREARRILENALGVGRKIGDPTAIALVLHQIGLLAEAERDHRAAELAYREAMELAGQEDQQQITAMIVGRLAGLARERGHYHQALQLYREKLILDRRTGDVEEIAETLHQLGLLAHAVGDDGLARQFHTEALDLMRRLDRRAGAVEALKHLGHLAYVREDYEAALRFYEEALGILRGLGNKGEIADLLRRLAFVVEELDGEVYDLLMESLTLSRELDDRLGVARSLLQLGAACQEEGRYDEAEGFYRECLEVVQGLGDPMMTSLVWQQLGELAQERAAWDEARQCYEKSLRIGKRFREEYRTALLLYRLGEVFLQSARYRRAKRAFQRSLHISERLGDQSAIAATLHRLGEVAEAQGHVLEARQLYEQSLAILEELEEMEGPYVEIVKSSLERVGSTGGGAGEIRKRPSAHSLLTRGAARLRSLLHFPEDDDECTGRR